MTKKKARARKPRSRVFITAYGASGQLVEKVEMTYDDFYGDAHPLIDKNAYRASRGIVRVNGEVYDSAGVRTQQFENFYSYDGKYVRGRTVHADGTVTDL